jgi:putative Holliday junction resolvase
MNQPSRQLQGQLNEQLPEQAQGQIKEQTQEQAKEQAKEQAHQQLVETILAVDFGTKKIGLALGNSLLRVARPLKTIAHRSNDSTFQEIQQFIQAWEITLLVVGLPRHPDGTTHAMTHRCTRFGNQLHGRFQLPVVWIDERYTSATAHDPRGDIDAQAAVMILEQYFASTPSETVDESVVRGNK